MNRDESKSKVDKSSSANSNSVLGRRREEGSSPSHSHVNNNLEEQQRLIMMFRSQGMPPPPAFNQHVNYMHDLEEEKRLMRLHNHSSFQDYGGDATRQQQEQDARFETMMAKLEEDLTYHWDDPDFCFSVDKLLGDIMEDDVNEGHLQQQPVSQAPEALGGSAD